GQKGNGPAGGPTSGRILFWTSDTSWDERPPLIVPFDPSRRLVIVRAELKGPAQTITIDLALDTGATETTIDEVWMALAGYTPAMATNQSQVITGSGVISALELPVTEFTCLGQSRTNFPVLVHNFPPATGHDGVLGLDFVRGHVLTIDFEKGEITFVPGSPA